MGLDLYVGTFNRYYRRDWQNLVQKAFPGAVQVIRPDDVDRVTDPDAIRQAIAAWKHHLSTGIEMPLEWSERDEQPYFTERPSWDCYGALLICAALDDQGLSPDSHTDPITVDNWSKHPALQRYKTAGTPTRWPQLLSNAEIWLPLAKPTVFQGPTPAGNTIVFGEVGALLAELIKLNARLWKIEPATAGTFRAQGADHGSSLRVSGQVGWAKMLAMAEAATLNRLPMLLDY